MVVPAADGADWEHDSWGKTDERMEKEIRWLLLHLAVQNPKICQTDIQQFPFIYCYYYYYCSQVITTFTLKRVQTFPKFID